MTPKGSQYWYNIKLTLDSRGTSYYSVPRNQVDTFALRSKYMAKARRENNRGGGGYVEVIQLTSNFKKTR